MKTIEEIYDNRCQSQEFSWAAAYWDSEEEQMIRFRQIVGNFIQNSFRHGAISALDVGCGQGDVLQVYPFFFGDYTGIDASGEMVEQAKNKNNRGDFIHSHFEDFEFDNTYDYVFAIGTLGLANPEQNHQFDYFRRMLHRMWELADYGVSFNMLSTKTPPSVLEKVNDKNHFWWFNPTQVLEECLSLTPLVKLDHYLPYEFSIHLHKSTVPKNIEI